MKKILKTFLIFNLILCFNLNSLWALDPVLKDLENEPTPDFKPPEIQIHEFENGLKLYFLKNNELPVFQMEAFIDVGEIDQPSELLGISSMMIQGLKVGGSKKYSGDEIDQMLEQAASGFSASVAQEYSKFGVQSLIKDSDLALKLFFDVIQSPRFEEEKLEIIRKQLLEAILRKNEDPTDVALRNFAKNLYGEKSVWARDETNDTVKKITQSDVFDFYKKYMAPNRMRLIVSGQIDFENLIKKINPYVLNWKKSSLTDVEIEPLEKKLKPLVNLVSKKGNQSTIVLGHFGEKRFSPDKYALILANQVLGGSTFGSRLGNVIRTQSGLAYTVYSSFGFDTDYGSFRVYASTKSQTTLEVIQKTILILNELISTNPVTQSELNNARQTILSSIIFEYEDPFNIVQARAYYDFFGYPADYLTEYQQEIKKVTLDEVHQAFKKYFYPDQLQITIVGDKEALTNLSELGEIKETSLEL